MFRDTAAKKPVRFNAKEFTIEDLSKPVLSKRNSGEVMVQQRALIWCAFYQCRESNSNRQQQCSFTYVNVGSYIIAKTIYFRLETVNDNGVVTYSKVVPVDLKWKDVLVLLRPNPVKEVLKIRDNNYAGNATIELYDILGKNCAACSKLYKVAVILPSTHLFYKLVFM